MLRIGIDKTDRTFRKFEYDDERKYGTPLMYKVLYEESGEFGEVMCSNVISIKKSNNIRNHFLDIPIYSEDKPEVVVSKPVNEEPVEKTKSTPTEGKKKTKSSKSKTKDVPLKGKAAEVKEISLELKPDVFIPKSYESYEYDVLIIDVTDVKEIKDRLNEMGHHGWEVCGFHTVQKMFGCQAMFIMKKGLK